MVALSKIVRRGALCALLPCLVASAATVPARAVELAPFWGLAGTWTGDGTIVMANGTRERIRCRAVYSVPPLAAMLDQGLRCASDSYQFDVRSHVLAAPDGSLSGTWSEAVHGVAGDVSGRVAAGRLETSVDTLGFSARLSVTTHGMRQRVSILPQGSEVQSVTIEMRHI